MISKIFHHIWYQSKDIPERYKPYYESAKRLHPKWKFMLWTEIEITQLLKKDYSWFLKTFDSFPNTIQKIDAAKMFILHKHGGIYSDIDIEYVKNIDDLVEGEEFVASLMRTRHPFLIEVGKHTTGLVLDYNNAFIACKPRHPIIEAMMYNFHSYIEKKGLSKISHEYYICASTGPSFYSKHVVDGRTTFKVKELHHTVIEAESSQNIAPETYAIHHTQNTWSPMISSAFKAKEFVQQNTLSVVLICILIILVAIVLSSAIFVAARINKI